MTLHNADLTINSRSGGCVQVIISNNVGQGNAGTSLSCRECFVAAGAYTVAQTSMVRMNIGSAASAAIGIVVPQGAKTAFSIALTTGINAPTPMRVPVDDVSDLYFYGLNDGDRVDILYRL